MSRELVPESTWLLQPTEDKTIIVGVHAYKVKVVDLTPEMADLVCA